MYNYISLHLPLPPPLPPAKLLNDLQTVYVIQLSLHTVALWELVYEHGYNVYKVLAYSVCSQGVHRFSFTFTAFEDAMVNMPLYLDILVVERSAIYVRMYLCA